MSNLNVSLIVLMAMMIPAAIHTFDVIRLHRQIKTLRATLWDLDTKYKNAVTDLARTNIKLARVHSRSTDEQNET